MTSDERETFSSGTPTLSISSRTPILSLEKERDLLVEITIRAPPIPTPRALLLRRRSLPRTPPHRPIIPGGVPGVRGRPLRGLRPVRVVVAGAAGARRSGAEDFAARAGGGVGEVAFLRGGGAGCGAGGLALFGAGWGCCFLGLADEAPFSRARAAAASSASFFHLRSIFAASTRAVRSARSFSLAGGFGLGRMGRSEASE